MAPLVYNFEIPIASMAADLPGPTEHYCYRTEGNRKIVIAYIIEEEQIFPPSGDVNVKYAGIVKYGAVVFRQDAPYEIFTKKRHRATARGRLEKHPVSDTYTWVNILDLECQLRNAMFARGTRSHSPGCADENVVDISPPPAQSLQPLSNLGDTHSGYP